MDNAHRIDPLHLTVEVRPHNRIAATIRGAEDFKRYIERLCEDTALNPQAALNTVLGLRQEDAHTHPSSFSGKMQTPLMSALHPRTPDDGRAKDVATLLEFLETNKSKGFIPEIYRELALGPLKHRPADRRHIRLPEHGQH